MAEQRSELEARITRLEAAVHHQHEYDALNQVVIEQASDLGELQRRIAHLEASLQRVVQEMPETAERDPVEEKPPHY